MSGGPDMKNESGVSSVVGVVLLLLLVVLAASVIGVTLSMATQNAAESTPNVIFTPSASSQMLYHSGGDILYKNRLVFYDNGVDITDSISIGLENTEWTEWRTGEAITLPNDYVVTNLTIIALDNLGREQLLYRGSGVPTTPLPTPITPTPTVTPTTTPTPTITPTPTVTPTTPTPTVTPTPTPTPSPYYEVGSDHGDGFATVGELVESLNNWSNALYGADVAKLSGHNIAFFGDVPIGREPINITGGMGTVILNNLGGGSLSEVEFTRAPGYEGELLVISSSAELKTTGATLKLDGMGHGAAPLLVITAGGSLDVNGHITLVNNTNPTGNGGAIRNEGSLDVSTNMIIYNNTARNGGGVYNVGTAFKISACDIHGNAASEKGGGIYNAGSSTVTINNANAKVYDNTATDGGGVYNAGTLTGGFPITGNTASGNGGGIYNAFSVTFTNGQPISGNSAGNGGGIYNTGTMRFGGPISSNTAILNGGGLYNTGSYTMNWGSFSGNTAGSIGNHVYASGTSTNSISGGVITLINGGGYYYAD